MQRTLGIAMTAFYLLAATALHATPPAPDTPHFTRANASITSNHWAWQAVLRTLPQPARHTSWPRDPFDRFISARLDANDLSPAPPADERRWLRRVTFDLLGLPPTITEIDAMLSDGSPDARCRSVDRLLGSPRFGEHWGQFWLDLVRYSETHGQEQDASIDNAYRYRDYVVRAFNQDVPYDHFVVEHLAGDLVDPPRIDASTRTNQSIQGTGFWLMTEANHIPIDLRGDESERRENQLEVFSKALLALTTNCARCHDHKFDTISTEDYYALCGYLQSSSYQQANVADPATRQRTLDQLVELRSKYAPRLLETYADAIDASRLGDYLIAALEGASSTSGEGLKPTILGRWVEILQNARQDIASPFYPIVRFAISKRRYEGVTIASTKQAVSEVWQAASRETINQIRSQKTIITREEGERNYVNFERPWEPSDQVLDYAHPGPEDWLSSGLRFGRSPARQGELLFGTDNSKPLAGILIEDAAHNELYSDRYVGILRSPTFEITSDTLWYRYRGTAEAFLVVDSYRCGATPGSVHHGKHLFRELEGGRNYRWQSHHVARYLGHRAHVEFTPQGDFSLSRIQFGASEPTESFEPNSRIVAILQQTQSTSLAALADQYGELFSQAARDLATHYMHPSARLGDAARLLDWLIAHGEVLDMPTDAMEQLVALWQAYSQEKAAIESQIPQAITAPALLDGNGEDEFVHLRGDHENLSKEPVPRRLLTALGGLDHPRPNHGSGRLQLAQQLTDPTNPLVARVIVNRVWQRLFGQGLVRTVDDFGVMGEHPSHPELLDYLAAELVENGWSLKRLIRRLVLTGTYGMSSRPHADAEQSDPMNRLLHRMPLRRLPAESIRDTMLSLSGRLDPTMYGPSVPAYYTALNKAYLIEKPSGPADGAGRRSIYIEVRRNQMLELLTTFGRPVPLTTVGQRDESTTTAQPLTLLNDPMVHKQAQLWAKRLLKDPHGSPTDRIDRAFQMALNRPPEEWETIAALTFLYQHIDQAPVDTHRQAWANFCHTLFNAKEFIFY